MAGAGRGRGRAGRNRPQNAWGGSVQQQQQQPRHPQQQQQPPQPGKKPRDENGGRTFQEASAHIQANLERHLASKDPVRYDDSSDEDEGGQVGGGGVSDELLDRALQNYGGQEIGARQTLEAAFGGGLSCLICISSIKKHDAIWSCENCYCSFHMGCIQRWAKDSIFQQKNEIELDSPDPTLRQTSRVLQWGCPKCRHSYAAARIPDRYTCYCAKVVDPPFDPWLAPHSCGETCGREFSPKCGHQCLVLCHPGPCPPCPKMVTSPCYCGQSAPATRRCHDKSWSCGKPCSKLLACGQHRCVQPCHPGECQPCPKVSAQLCQCKRSQTDRKCAEPIWQCEEKCGKRLSCGHHKCDLVCHTGSCPPCPLDGVRQCPCGKSTFTLPCTQATPTCGDTCGKPLQCGQHVCQERCHRGPCGSCLQMVVKQCRCGAKRKEVPCAKVFACDLKCKRQRDCRKHACNRKCCDDDCPPCEQTCNKTLNCKNHKCAGRCHQGACYPCTQTKEVTCSCGASKVLVPCGMEKIAKPPKCKKPCQSPSDCHHPEREKHNCHFGPCPPCKQTCGRSLKCEHLCPESCHDKVKVFNSGVKGSVPWEELKPGHEIKATACPPCQVPVPITCLGGHETSDWPCHAAKAGSCGRKCGRQLPCQNCFCERDCHKVKNAPDLLLAGANCRKCEKGCSRPRPDGCVHQCSKPCHPGDCDPCKQIIRISCHCGLTQPYVKCGEWTSASDEEKARLSCCQDQCPKTISCGHRCSKVCHPGDCSSVQDCKKRTKIYCPCKRRKEEKPCGKARNMTAPLKCDDECKEAKNTNKNHQDPQESEDSTEKWRRDEEKRREKEELERFEKAMEGGKKRRNRDRRNRGELMEDQGFLGKHKVIILSSFLVLLLGLGVGFYAIK